MYRENSNLTIQHCAFEQGKEPCVPGSCPLITATHSLPANPFYANIVAGRCKCLPPQKCDGGD
jgi:hypothetical protein|eukprot:COSAG06_NODE_6953_length_2701_cov_1.923905_1_plen_63_part_00